MIRSLLRRLPEGTRVRLGRTRDRLRIGSARALAGVAALPLRVLPDGVRVELLDRLAMRRPLDYGRERLMMVVSSRVELDTRLRSCSKEPETVAWLEDVMSPAAVFYDIGANVGAYSLVAASLAGGSGRVYAFEPGYRTFPNLVENVLLNGQMDRVVPLPIALGDRTGLARFAYADIAAGSARHAGLAADAADAAPARAVAQPLIVCRLDDAIGMFGLTPPTCIKIDVDGTEKEILAGAERVLQSPALAHILVEVDEGDGMVEHVRAVLAGHGFELVQQHRRGAGATWNLIFRRPTNTEA